MRVWRDLRQLLWPRRRVFALGLLLVTVNRLAGLARPAATKVVVDDVVGRGRADLLWLIVAAVGASLLVQAATSYMLRIVTSRSAHELVADLRIRLQEHVGRLPIRYFDRNKTGALVSRVMSDVEGIHNLIGTGFMRTVGDIVTSVAAVAFLFWMNTSMTVTSLVLLSAFVLILRRLLGTVRPIILERQRMHAEVRGRLTESFSGIRVIKGFRAEEREAEAFRRGAQQILDNVKRGATSSAVMSTASTCLLGIVNIVVLVLSTRLMISGQMTVGDFVFYTMLLGVTLTPLSQIVDIGSNVSNAIVSMDRVREVLAEPAEDADPRRTVPLGTIDGGVVFDGVGFHYDGGRPVLRGISLEARPGTVTALVGSSGSGKSTLVGLVAAFHTPASGTIRIDGVDLATVRLDSYRQQLGVVLQDNFVFDGTIRENIRFSRPLASDRALEDAAAMAGVDAFVAHMADGYDTLIGERGIKLSGGQRQRVAIARAILADPRILILDEATSSLDRESEAQIQDALTALMRGRTTFVIAHRLSTIRYADQILVLEDGEIVERGTHASLIARRGRYFDLSTWQDQVRADTFINPGEVRAQAV